MGNDRSKGACPASPMGNDRSKGACPTSPMGNDRSKGACPASPMGSRHWWQWWQPEEWKNRDKAPGGDGEVEGHALW